MPSCKYCNEPMARKNEHLKVSFYMCPKCGARGPCVSSTASDEELDLLTLGRQIDVAEESDTDYFRKMLQNWSGDYSRLKSVELPKYTRLLRETNNAIKKLQSERNTMSKSLYFDRLGKLYQQKGYRLENLRGKQLSLDNTKDRIRLYREKLKDAKQKES